MLFQSLINYSVQPLHAAVTSLNRMWYKSYYAFYQETLRLNLAYKKIYWICNWLKREFTEFVTDLNAKSLP